MKKNQRLVMIMSIAVAVVLLSAGTYSYFRDNINGDIIGTIDNLVLDGENIATGQINYKLQRSESEKFILPGDSGSFSFVVDATGSTTNVNAAVSITGINLPKNIKFYSDSEKNHEISSKIYNIPKSKSMKHVITIYWYYDDSISNNDNNLAPQNITDITINVVAISNAS